MNKVKKGRSFGNTLKRKEGRSLGNGGSTLLEDNVVFIYIYCNKP